MSGSAHPAPRPEKAPEASRVAAFFDVDGTLTKSDIFRDLVTFRRQARKDLLFDLSLPLRGLLLLGLDQVSRVAVNRLTYSWYGGFRRDEFIAWAARFQASAGRRRLLEAPLQLLAHHARAGHRIVLLTGAVDLLVAPLPQILASATGEDACLAMRVEAVPLEAHEGVFTGRLGSQPLGEEEKARRARAIAAEEGLDLQRSFAYGDSIADLPLLRSVGRPAAVRPDWRLRRVARRRGWPVLDAPSLLPETR
jgi:fatty acyl-CoA reductase